ncbi:MAG: ABC transporter permease [Hydrogenophilaceae bacterium]|jgi:ABC-2 type transport system permease protein|nr:ABC transporter permease [Hydrogenophilaceae bacterium]
MKLPAIKGFSLRRLGAIFFKEFVQMRRDRLTFAMMVAVPVMQLFLFGYAINNDPRHMAAAVEIREDGVFTRSFLAGLKNSTYFDIVAVTTNEEDGERMLRSGRAAFLIVVPEGFERRLVRGERPQVLVAADASDPVAAGGAVNAVAQIAQRALARDLEGPLSRLGPAPAPFDVIVHRRYNPAGITAYNIVPGLLGVILTMTLVMITSIALTRESERGTLEALLATPARPVEVMIGKTTPYILVGAVQVALVVALAMALFRIPFYGSVVLFAGAVTLFIFTNLMLGYLISTLARTQMQAMQMTFFVFLPSILLSGFMFPFRAMPGWAQAIGEALPLTHFLRIVRELMLKGADAADIAGDVWPLALILAVLAALALLRYRRTLD